MHRPAGNSEKPPLVRGEHVLVITQVNPSAPTTAVAVTMRNLLSAFDPSSYTTAYLGRFEWRPRDTPGASVRLIPNFHPVQAIDRVITGTKQAHAVRRAVALAERRNAAIVVGLYPTLSSLHVATEVARRTGARYFPYLHDTVVEGLSHSPMAADAKVEQEKALGTAVRVLTMSEGMTDYYRQAYGLETYPLEHSYPEPIAAEPGIERTPTAFWAGDVYEINHQSVARVQRALRATGTPFELTCRRELPFERDENVTKVFYPTRQDYMAAVNRHGVLVLAINWPDESRVHEAELSTIFPTKTNEYLATGGPILVHCPEHYFLARFINRHRCGVVVSERSEDALARAIRVLQAGGPEVHAMQQRALQAAKHFSLERVSTLFQGYLTK